MYKLQCHRTNVLNLYNAGHEIYNTKKYYMLCPPDDKWKKEKRTSYFRYQYTYIYIYTQELFGTKAKEDEEGEEEK